MRERQMSYITRRPKVRMYAVENKEAEDIRERADIRYIKNKSTGGKRALLASTIVLLCSLIWGRIQG